MYSKGKNVINKKQIVIPVRVQHLRVNTILNAD